MRTLFLTILFSLFVFRSLVSQTTVVIKTADALSAATVGQQKVQKLIGNVWLKQKNTNIYCDSAYLYTATNSAVAFSNVRIIDQVDPINLSGDYLEYDGNERVAKVRQGVVLKDDSVRLYTDSLDYDRNTQTGYYFNGGQLVDSANVLTSQKGYYHTNTKVATFIDSVHLNNPDYQLWTDTLEYATIGKNAITRGKSSASSAKGDSLRSDTGVFYDSQKKYSEVYSGVIITSEYEIEGDTLIADDRLQFYKGKSNVRLLSINDSLTVYGNHVDYYQANGTAWIYDNAYLKKMLNGDSLFIKSDTLFSIQDSIANKKYLTAFHNVKMYKSNLQGKADSVVYNVLDSTIYMYDNPVLWNVDSQLSADSINIQMANNKISKMNLYVNSFVIAQDSLLNFNQVKGRNMQVHFKEGQISRADVFGNGESIYFAPNQNVPNSSSMNKLKCSNMRLFFENNTVTELRNYTEIDGRFVPPIEILDPERKLRGFQWRIDEKPRLSDILQRAKRKR